MSSNRVIALAGFGVEGRAAYEYFKGTADIHIFDEGTLDRTGVDATFHEGLVIPDYIDVVYKSPGIPSRHLTLASEKTRVTTLMDVVLEQVRDRAVGVTGTKGKSTTAALIQHILEKSGKETVLFGNIGVADMQLVKHASPDTIFVMELSSYQCEYLTHSPHIALLTNLYEEHLSHHGSFDAYRKAKLNLARFQTADDVFINGSTEETHFAGKPIRPALGTPFKTQLIGEHNQHNCALAVAAVEVLGISEEAARKHIASFKTLPYRLENLGAHKGITFYDDSLATIPEATLASIKALPKVDTLILGGEDRGISFSAFAKALPTTGVRTCIVFPDTGAKMVTEMDPTRVHHVSSMDEAVQAAFQYTPVGGTVLLSNASPSFNIFKDYKDKSARYRTAIEKYEV